MKKNLLTLIAGLFIVASVFAFTLNEKTAKVEQVQGMYIYIKCKPSDTYDYLGTVNSAAVVKSYKVGDMVPHMIKRAKEKHPEANGLIFIAEDLTKVDAIVVK